jgi:hypothetical protein
VVIETIDDKGQVQHRELVKRHSLESEAVRTLQNSQRMIEESGNTQTHVAILWRL